MISKEHETNDLFLSSIILYTQSLWKFKVCIISYLLSFILNNLIILSLEHEAKILVLIVVIQIIVSLCSLIVKSG